VQIFTVSPFYNAAVNCGCAVSAGLDLSEAIYIMKEIGSTGWLMYLC